MGTCGYGEENCVAEMVESQRDRGKRILAESIDDAEHILMKHFQQHLVPLSKMDIDGVRKTITKLALFLAKRRDD